MFTLAEKIIFAVTFVAATIAGLVVPHFTNPKSTIQEKYVEVFEQPTIVGFQMRGCAPCLRQKVEWNALMAQGYRLVVYDVHDNADLAERLGGVRVAPTTFVVVDGKTKPRKFEGWTPAKNIANYARECKTEDSDVEIDIGPLHIHVN